MTSPLSSPDSGVERPQVDASAQQYPDVQTHGNRQRMLSRLDGLIYKAQQVENDRSRRASVSRLFKASKIAKPSKD